MESFDAMFAANVRAAFVLVAAFAPGMVAATAMERAADPAEIAEVVASAI